MISLGGVVALEARARRLVRHRRRDPGATCGASTASRSASARRRRSSSRSGRRARVDDEFKAEVRGRDLMTGLPKTIMLVPEEVRGAIEEQVARDLRRGDRVPRADAARARAGPHPATASTSSAAAACCAASTGASARRPSCPVHLVDAPLECVVLGAGRCLESFDSLEGHVHGARRALISASSVAASQQVLGGLADLPVGVRERGVRARPRRRRPSNAASASTARRRIAGLSSQPARTAGSAVGIADARRARRPPASRTSGSACSTAAARERGQRRGGGVGLFAERERGRFGDPRVVVAEQREQPVDRRRPAERGRRLGGPPPHRGVGVAGSRAAMDARPISGAPPRGERTECGGADARLRVVLHHLGQLARLPTPSSCPAPSAAAAAACSRASSGAVTPSTVANLCHIARPRYRTVRCAWQA